MKLLKLLIHNNGDIVHFATLERLDRDAGVWVLQPLCHNGGLDLADWDCIERPDEPVPAIRGKRLCRVCDAAQKMKRAPRELSGKEQYERVMGKEATR